MYRLRLDLVEPSILENEVQPQPADRTVEKQAEASILKNGVQPQQAGRTVHRLRTRSS